MCNLKTFKTDLNRPILVVLLLFVLTGCSDRPATVIRTPAPFSCARFSESLWAEFRIGVDSPDDVVATVTRLWEIDASEIGRIELSGPEPLELTWRGFEGELTYYAQFRKGRLFKFAVKLSPPLTLAQAIGCLGNPEYFEAHISQGIESPILIINIWYQEKGLVVHHISFPVLLRQSAASPAQRMDSYTVVAPGTPEQMVSNVFTLGENPYVQARGLCLLRPWPGLIERMEVESFLKEVRC